MECKTLNFLNILGKKWDATVLEEIGGEDGINFDKLVSMNPNIYPKTLDKALKDLVNNGLVNKKIFYLNKIKHSQYSITSLGKRLLASFETFKNVNCLDSTNQVKQCGDCESGPNKL
jgi:DNA-binding HxlR family transcriptional regulator